MANEKIIAQDVFEQSIKDILQLIADNTYNFTEYTSEEIGNLVELDPTKVAELTAVINDSVVAKNKVFSSFHTKELLQENIIEANKYADDLVANLSNIKLDIVDTLPDSTTVNKSTIYILKDSTGGTNNTLNVWSDSTSDFVEVGKLDVNMDSYYDKGTVDTLLADKADKDSVVTPDDIITDTTQATGTNVLAASTTITELDKKIDKSAILSSFSSTATDENTYSAKYINGALDEKVGKTSILTSYSDATTDEHVLSGLLVKGIFDRMSMWNRAGYFSGDLDTIEVNSVYNVDSSNSQNTPVNHWGFVITMMHAYAATYSTQIFISMQNASGHGVYMRIKDGGTWGAWRKISPTVIADVPTTSLYWVDTTYFKSVFTGCNYQVKNGVCFVNIDMICNAPINGGYDLPIVLPKPSTEYVHAGVSSLPNTTYEHSSITIAIANSGNTVNVYGGVVGDRYLGVFSYPVAES